MGGGGEALPDFFFPPCSADHERDWPPCKVVFFGLATNTQPKKQLDMKTNPACGLMNRYYCIAENSERHFPCSADHKDRWLATIPDSCPFYNL